jgi:hypothetical protein
MVMRLGVGDAFIEQPRVQLVIVFEPQPRHEEAFTDHGQLGVNFGPEIIDQAWSRTAVGCTFLRQRSRSSDGTSILRLAIRDR